MKNSGQLSFVLLLPILFLILFPAFSVAEETTAGSETPQVDITVKTNPEMPAVAPKQAAPQTVITVPEKVQPENTAPTQPSLFTSYGTNETASKAVERSIGLFSTRIKEKFSLWLSRSGQYLDMMKEILRKKDVPEDIVFLSLIESGFNPNAYSIARAVGPWQFIASTARRYGLEINWWKDERRDPVKSTEAAA
ncbi:MAG: transglycosylase SLT domain-containing protein, partial [Nitrospiraceae bacterium]|nr:transglycosylase SLT domain-containing protein [Nitrospiraceae bacterium]